MNGRKTGTETWWRENGTGRSGRRFTRPTGVRNWRKSRWRREGEAESVWKGKGLCGWGPGPGQEPRMTTRGWGWGLRVGISGASRLAAGRRAGVGGGGWGWGTSAVSIEWLLIADDLTGACDAGVQFARRGMASCVMLARDAPPAGVRVVAVNTESRHLEEDAAGAAVAAVADWITGRAVFKKIDSVLRGIRGRRSRRRCGRSGARRRWRLRHFRRWDGW